MVEYFTRAQAEALLPRLTASLRLMQRLRADLADCERELHDMQIRIASNGHLPLEDLGELPALVNDLTQRIAECAREITESGALVKDPDMGLLDFPSLREGREVYLCWRLGEERVAWWHEVDSGLSGRRPLEDDEGGATE